MLSESSILFLIPHAWFILTVGLKTNMPLLEKNSGAQ